MPSRGLNFPQEQETLRSLYLMLSKISPLRPPCPRSPMVDSVGIIFVLNLCTLCTLLSEFVCRLRALDKLISSEGGATDMISPRRGGVLSHSQKFMYNFRNLCIQVPEFVCAIFTPYSHSLMNQICR